ncbi:MAG: NVEALA domain-containing protein [Bacteroidales bacterium]
MKTKKVLFAAAFAAVTLLSGYNYVQNNNKVKLSDLALANVEALASGEFDPTSCIGPCFFDPNWNCEGYNSNGLVKVCFYFRTNW